MADVFQDRDGILADFQACTGIDDFGECIAHLEQNNWNLTAAVNCVLSGSHDTDDIGGIFNDIPPTNTTTTTTTTAFRDTSTVADSITNITTTTTSTTSSSSNSYHSYIPQLYSELNALPPPLVGELASWAQSSVLTPHSAFNPTSVGLQIPQLSRQRILKIIVKYKSRDIPVSIPDTHSIGKLKSILEEKARLSKSRMSLIGFPQINLPDTTVLSSLELPREFTLYLTISSSTHKQSPTGASRQGAASIGPRPGGATAALRTGAASTSHKPTSTSNMSKSKTDRSSVGNRFCNPSQSTHQNDIYTLNVTNRDTNRVHTIRLSGSTSILKVKMDVYDLTDIPVARQRWTGWPSSTLTDNMTLCECGIAYPIDMLTVTDQGRSVSVSHTQSSTSTTSTSSTSSTSSLLAGTHHTDESSDVDEFIDATSFNIDDDDINVCDTPSNTRKPLLTADSIDDANTMRNLTQVFEEKYGDCHPLFFEGSLDDAVEHALSAYSCNEKTPLAIYLHHDNSIFSNIFCSEILCNEGIVSYLSQHFTTWAWDMTEPSNEIRIREWFESNLQSRLTSGSITAISADEYPLLIVLTRTRTTLEILHVIKGDATLDNLMVELLQAYESFTGRRDKEVLEERERIARDRVIQEQNEAYEQSLRADRAKSKAKQEEETNRRLAEQQAEHTYKMKEEKKQSFALLIDDEPAEDSNQCVSRIKLRLPNGEIIIRRFSADSCLQSLLNFIASKGYSADEYKVLTAFPKKDLTTINPELTLTQLQFCPQEMITIEEK